MFLALTGPLIVDGVDKCHLLTLRCLHCHRPIDTDHAPPHVFESHLSCDRNRNTAKNYYESQDDWMLKVWYITRLWDSGYSANNNETSGYWVKYDFVLIYSEAKLCRNSGPRIQVYEQDFHLGAFWMPIASTYDEIDLCSSIYWRTTLSYILYACYCPLAALAQITAVHQARMNLMAFDKHWH